MICGGCYEETEETPCVHCGEEALLKERYRLEERIGRGSSGFTWRGWDDRKGRAVAIKEVSLKRLRGVKEWELFEREARVLESLKMVGVPEFEEMFTREEPRRVEVYLVMEWVEARPLSLEEGWSEEEVLGFLESMVEVLKELGSHHPGVVHRDIKPSNVLGERGGPFWLIDFGATARLRNATLPGSTVAGSYGYMAPEQLRGESSSASDVYGLGATAVALLAGREADELIDHRGRLSWSEEVQVSRPLEALLESMLEVDPGRRLHDGGELSGALGRCRRELEGGGKERALRAKAEPGRGAAWYVRGLAWLNRGAGGIMISYLAALLGFALGFLPFALMVLIPLSWIFGSEVIAFYFSIFDYTNSHVQQSHLFAMAIAMAVMVLGPGLERSVRGLPDFWRDWRSIARWGGRLRSRERLLRRGGVARGLRLMTAAGAAATGFLGAEHLILTLTMSFPGVFFWPPSGVIATLMVVGLFLPLFLATEVLARRRGSVAERFLPGGVGIWSEGTGERVEAAAEILGQHKPEKEELEGAREVREGLVCVGAEQRLQREVLWLLDLGGRKEKDWVRALRYVERCTGSSEELVQALDWVSEGLAGEDRELSWRVYQAARAHEGLLGLGEGEEEVILDLEAEESEGMESGEEGKSRERVNCEATTGVRRGPS